MVRKKLRRGAAKFAADLLNHVFRHSNSRVRGYKLNIRILRYGVIKFAGRNRRHFEGRALSPLQLRFH